MTTRIKLRTKISSAVVLSDLESREIVYGGIEDCMFIRNKYDQLFKFIPVSDTTTNSSNRTWSVNRIKSEIATSSAISGTIGNLTKIGSDNKIADSGYRIAVDIDDISGNTIWLSETAYEFVNTTVNSVVNEAISNIDVSSKADRPSTFTLNNVAKLDAQGDPIDSGYKILDTNPSSTTLWSSAKIEDYVLEMVQGLDWQDSVLDFHDASSALPVDPADGDRYLCEISGNGWTADYIYEYVYNGSTWEEIIPNSGFTVWVEADDTSYVFNGSAWISSGSGSSHNNLTSIQGGDTGEYYHLTLSEYNALTAADLSVDDATLLHHHDSIYGRKTVNETLSGSWTFSNDLSITGDLDVDQILSDAISFQIGTVAVPNRWIIDPQGETLSSRTGLTLKAGHDGEPIRNLTLRWGSAGTTYFKSGDGTGDLYTVGSLDYTGHLYVRSGDFYDIEDRLESELSTNGDMELDSDWSDYGTPLSNTRSDEQKNAGTYSRKLVIDGANQGIAQNNIGPFTIGYRYGLIVWIRGDGTAALTIKVRATDDTWTFSTNITPSNAVWTKYYLNILPTATKNANIEIYSTSSSGTVYIDDLSLMKIGGDVNIYGELNVKQNIISLANIEAQTFTLNGVSLVNFDDTNVAYVNANEAITGSWTFNENLTLDKKIILSGNELYDFETQENHLRLQNTTDTVASRLYLIPKGVPLTTKTALKLFATDWVNDGTNYQDFGFYVTAALPAVSTHGFVGVINSKSNGTYTDPLDIMCAFQDGASIAWRSIYNSGNPGTIFGSSTTNYMSTHSIAQFEKDLLFHNDKGIRWQKADNSVANSLIKLSTSNEITFTVIGSTSATIAQTSTTINSGVLYVGSAVDSPTIMALAANSGQYRTFRIYSGEIATANLRWAMGGDSDAEGGANAGSSMSLWAYSDSGVLIDNVLTINRAAAGTFTINRPLNVTASITGTYLISSTINPSVILFETDTTDLNARIQVEASVFKVMKVNDANSGLSTPLSIDLATGAASFGYAVTIAGVLTLSAATSQINSTSASNILDFDIKSGTTANATETFRYGRTTNSGSGTLYTEWYKGDNTATLAMTLNHKTGDLTPVGNIGTVAGRIYSGTDTAGYHMNVQRDGGASPVRGRVYNTGVAAGDNVFFGLACAGANNPYFQLSSNLSGAVGYWSVGLDAAAANAFKLSNTYDLSAAKLTLTPTGDLTISGMLVAGTQIAINSANPYIRFMETDSTDLDVRINLVAGVFNIYKVSDANAVVSTPLSINMTTLATTIGGDLTVSGGDIIAGVSGTTRGVINATRGASTNTPASIFLESADGTDNWYFAANNGAIRRHTSLPTTNVDGFELGSIVVALTDAVTITVDASLGNIFTVTLGGNRTMGAPSNPVNGQKIFFRIRQDATGSRTITWDAAYRFGTTVTSPTLTTTAAKTDYIGFTYNSTDSKWDCLAVALGY